MRFYRSIMVGLTALVIGGVGLGVHLYDKATSDDMIVSPPATTEIISTNDCDHYSEDRRKEFFLTDISDRLNERELTFDEFDGLIKESGDQYCISGVPGVYVKQELSPNEAYGLSNDYVGLDSTKSVSQECRDDVWDYVDLGMKFHNFFDGNKEKLDQLTSVELRGVLLTFFDKNSPKELPRVRKLEVLDRIVKSYDG